MKKTKNLQSKPKTVWEEKLRAKIKGKNSKKVMYNKSQ